MLAQVDLRKRPSLKALTSVIFLRSATGTNASQYLALVHFSDSATETNSKACRYVLLHVSIQYKPYSDGGSDFHRFREAYDDAFHRLSVAVHEHGRVADAEREHHERRGSLAEIMINADRLRKQRLAVERLAYSLWEQAGYPSGTAESDWHRAEALFRQR